jgi:DNA-binding response OmpR family regulator
MRQLLSEDGFSVEWLRDGRAAIARIDEGLRPDAILMDYKLPHEDGFALARKARARWPGILIVFVTSYPEVVAREPALDPPVKIVSKPVAYDELVASLDALLGVE